MTPDLPELPKLPDAAATVWDDYYDGITLSAQGPHDRYEFRDVFTPEQMRAYGRECYEAGVRAGSSQAVKACAVVLADEARTKGPR